MKTALVTGAGARIGQSLAIRLAQMGYAVAVHYRQSRASAEQSIATIRSFGGQAKPVQADLCNAVERSKLIRAAEEALGSPIDLLVNNAAAFTPDTALNHTRPQWDTHMELNLHVPVALSQSFAQRLPASGQGHIVNIIDQRIHNPDPAYFTYSLSKMGLWTATQMLAQALAPNIRVNAIGPGAILTASHESEASFASIAEARLIPHPPGLEDLADALTYLTEAPAVTGQMLTIDSGLHMVSQAASERASRTPLPGHKRTLSLDGLEVAAEIGVYESEQGQTQPLVCALQIALEPASAPESLSDTLDYATLCAMAHKIAGSQHFLLLESFAEALVDAIVGMPHVYSVTLQVTKPRALDYIGAVPGVTVQRFV